MQAKAAGGGREGVALTDAPDNPVQLDLPVKKKSIQPPDHVI